MRLALHPFSVQNLLLAGLAAANMAAAHSQEKPLEQISLSDLMAQRTELYQSSDTASGVQETLKDAPAAMLVIDQKTIELRGYQHLTELLEDAPGFDTYIYNGTVYSQAYQRGYRTPWTQRTLLLINGKVDNNLWNHTALISRQYPINIIDRVEILYGPAGVVYGPNAFLGVINIITKTAKSLSQDEIKLDASISLASFKSQAVDMALLGKYGDFYINAAFRDFSSDEADLDDYAEWGYTQENLLSDPRYWGNGIGTGVDPATGNTSPNGDINVDGVVSDDELRNGRALGRYYDPSDNHSFFAEVGWQDWQLGFLDWQTSEGYGLYYSFADGQPNAAWQHNSKQWYLENSSQWQKLKVDSLLLQRESQVGGDWVEAFGGAVNISVWNSFNKAWRFEQDYQYQYSEQLNINWGLKYERKTLTRTYALCNYFNGFGFCPSQGATSSTGFSSDGSGVKLAAQINSLDFTPLPPTINEQFIDPENQGQTTDKGAYSQLIWDNQTWRFSTGLRFDDNSIYGSQWSPRAAAIYRWNPKTTVKLVYGQAFQEPSPKDLYGQFNGREANANLKPEKLDNIELILLHQGRYWFHDISLYNTYYSDVIAGSQNVGQRHIHGVEYKGKFRFSNFVNQADKITGHLFYSWTQARAQQQYDNSQGIWIDDWDEQGDIAPHKLNMALNVPLSPTWHWNLMARWSSAKNLFSENPLRASSNQNRDTNTKASAFWTLDSHWLYQQPHWQLGFKVDNIFAQDYLAPGPEGASSGDDFSQDYDGFQNSLVPQLNQRTYRITWEVKL